MIEGLVCSLLAVFWWDEMMTEGQRQVIRNTTSIACAHVYRKAKAYLQDSSSSGNRISVAISNRTE